MRTAAFMGAVLVLAAGLTGCGKGQPYLDYERLNRGLVIVLTGIEGRSRLNEDICRGLDEGGVDCAIELYDWTPSIPLKQILPPVALYSQRALSRNRAQAEKLVGRIISYQMAYPRCPVVLVGQSGGAAIAAWTAEGMPSNRPLDGVIMLAPSLSPGYMLDQALMNTRRGIINFYSSRDLFFLALGTTVAGTMDGEHTQSAGRAGFEVPAAGGKPSCYDKLHQIAWSSKMAETGNYGMHLSSGGAKFVAAYVAPFVKARAWNGQFVASVLNQTSSPPPPAAGKLEGWRPGRSLDEETSPRPARSVERSGPSMGPHGP